jgi:hypothetical protein
VRPNKKEVRKVTIFNRKWRKFGVEVEGEGMKEQAHT